MTSRPRECETYLLCPAAAPSRPRARSAAPLPPREQTDIAGAETDEIEHQWQYLIGIANPNNPDR